MPSLTNPRASRYSTSVNAGWYEISGVNFNENGTLRVDIDFYVTEQDFVDQNSPIDSAQYQIDALPAVANSINASLLANTDIDG